MGQFPDFMRNPVNKILVENQHNNGAEGYVFDGADGSQMVFWTYPNGGISAERPHPYDEYLVVVEMEYSF